MINHPIKNLILCKLVVVEGRLLRDTARAENPLSNTQKITIFLNKKNGDFGLVLASDLEQKHFFH